MDMPRGLRLVHEVDPIHVVRRETYLALIGAASASNLDSYAEAADLVPAAELGRAIVWC